MTTTGNVPSPRQALTVEQENTPMGEVLSFPGQPRDTASVVVHADGQRLDTDQDTGVVDEPTGEPTRPVQAVNTPGTDLVPDTRSRQVARVERGPLISPAVAGRARQAAKAAVPVSKFTARHLYYLAGGLWDTASSTYARWTGRNIDAQIAAAVAAGEHGVAAELMRQRMESKKLFLERIKVFGQFLVRLPVIVAGVSAVTLVLTLIVSIVAWARPGGLTFTEVWDGLFTAVVDGAEWTVWAVTVPLPALLVTAITGVLVKGYNTRRRNQNAPSWVLSTAGADDPADTVDEGSILGALRNLGIPALNDAFKKGWGTPEHPTRVWEMGLGKDGRGWRCQIRLPQAVPVSEINRKKERLAHNLGRLPVEVWATEPKDKPSVLDLWIAEPGVLTGPVDPWPLLAELETAVADYFAGVPVAIDIRGDEVTGEFSGKNWAAAGEMGSGKSTLVITALLGIILDPLVEVDVFVMAQNSDYELMRPRLRQLVTGAGADTVKACMNTLHELYDELDIRGKALAEHTRAGDPDAEKVTRRLAEKDSRLRPRVLVVDECQALFMDEKHGKRAQDLTILLMNAARKYGITLIFMTPEPSTDSLPRKLMAVMSNKACFAIGDQQSNDAILGTSAYKRGISAVGLEPKTKNSNGDVGTAMTSRGFLAKPGLMRTYYVPRTQHKAIVERALQLREQANITAAPVVDTSEADPLADIAAVIGDQPRMRTQEVLQRLAARNPAAYRSWTFTALTDVLTEADAAPYKSHGAMVVSAHAVQRAITERDECGGDGDDWDDDGE